MKTTGNESEFIVVKQTFSDNSVGFNVVKNIGGIDITIGAISKEAAEQIAETLNGNGVAWIEIE